VTAADPETTAALESLRHRGISIRGLRKSSDALERRYAVRRFPTLVIADGDEHERARMVGFRDRKSVDDLLTSSIVPAVMQPDGGAVAR
jgi:hypothetical protein